MKLIVAIIKPFKLDEVRDALAATDLATFYGRITFNEAGHRLVEPVVWRQVQDGKYNIVAPSAHATHNFQWPRSGL